MISCACEGYSVSGERILTACAASVASERMHQELSQRNLNSMQLSLCRVLLLEAT